ncbi:MAG: hypothetical protein RL605_705 [Actinomycetota bacterium]
MKATSKLALAGLATIALATSSITAAQAHVSIIPGVTAAGSSTEAITAGKSGVLNFRIGHGCTLALETTNPVTATSMVGTNWATKQFDVIVPVVATNAGATIPKPAFVPGWTNSVVKNSDGTFTVSWIASAPAFYIPDAPAGNAGGKTFFDFGISIKWNADQSGKTVFFPSKQTCEVDVPGKAAVKKNGKVKTAAIKARKFNIYNSWDVTDGSGADTVADNTEHNTAPSVTVK